MAAARSRRPPNPMAQRERRAKIGAAIGLVLFLAVAAYEVPSILKMLNQKAPAPPPAAAVTTGSLPNVAGTTPAAPAAPSGQLVDTDVPPASAGDGLVAFSVFQTKNPFRPQGVAATTTPAAASATPAAASAAPAAASAAPAPTSTTAAPSTSAPAASTPARGSSSGPSGGSSPQPTTLATVTTPARTAPTRAAPSAPAAAAPASTTASAPTPAPAPAVVVSVNGKDSRVQTDDTFPSGAPVFRLAGWTKTSAEIGIVGGSYASGGATLTIRLHQPVTLENTSTGKRYTLVLVSTP